MPTQLPNHSVSLGATAMIGAQLDVASTSGQGTRITVEIASPVQP
ncbi:MAG: hypothetical protein AB8I69_00340 [Anaerolineae bacterium]